MPLKKETKPGSHWPRLVGLVRIPSLGKMELFNQKIIIIIIIISYLKPYNSIQIIYIMKAYLINRIQFIKYSFVI